MHKFFKFTTLSLLLLVSLNSKSNELTIKQVNESFDKATVLLNAAKNLLSNKKDILDSVNGSLNKVSVDAIEAAKKATVDHAKLVTEFAANCKDETIKASVTNAAVNLSKEVEQNLSKEAIDKIVNPGKLVAIKNWLSASKDKVVKVAWTDRSKGQKIAGGIMLTAITVAAVVYLIKKDYQKRLNAWKKGARKKGDQFSYLGRVCYIWNN